MENTTEDLAFLPYLLEEEIYFIDSEPASNTIVVVEEAIVVKEVAEIIEVKEFILVKEEVIVREIKVPDVKIEKPEVTVTVAEPKPELIKEQKAFKKIVILIGYPAAMPANVTDSMLKIFSALQIPMLDIEIINVLDPNAKKIEDFTFYYLILMGGTGKNIEHLKDFIGTRNRYDIATHKGFKIYFAEAMDIYMKPENIELKKKFWAKLKEVFGQ
jgi:hypothetical protein